MKEKIGETAGKIWKILQKEDEVSVSRLVKMVDEKSSLVYQALGWLARENKINFRREANKHLVSLIESEKKI
ncbi:MAG: winged helix-turn-helix domain-containing protein [Acidobacteriota bacterium]